MLPRSIASLACTALLATASFAQTSVMKMGKASGKPLASPVAYTSTKFDSKSVSIKYNSPSMHGRKIMGDLVPYDRVWRTGANEATTLVTEVNLSIGNLAVPAGTYTVYTLPTAGTWQLIINKQTGQWGTVYNDAMDLGRVPMQGHTLAAPQEKMTISFEKTKAKSAELHVKWENTDQQVTVTAQ